MNTPAHATISLLLLGRKNRPETAVPIVIGAALPDVPMMVFYAYEKLIQNTPEGIIWSDRYHQPGWQALFDVFNSLPLIMLGMLLAYKLGASRWTWFFAGMALHVFGDLPLHHGDDAHRHFFPLLCWKFYSPVSYWDPDHYGGIVSAIEAALVFIGSILLMFRYESLRHRVLVASIAVLYALYWGYVIVVWM